MVPAPDTVRTVLRALHELSIPCMITGSLASNLYGVPRMSKDADVVVLLAPGKLNELAAALEPKVRLDRQPSFEGVTATTRWILTADDGCFTIELFELSDDAHDQARFSRRKPLEVFGVPTSIPTVEDVLVQKVRWGGRANRRKDIDDALNILLVSGEAIDWPYVHRWCDLHGTRALLDSLCAQAGIAPQRP